MQKCALATAWYIYLQLLKFKELPTHDDLKLLANLTNTEIETEQVFSQIKQFQVWVLPANFNHLIEKMTAFSKAWEIYQCMQSLGTRPNQITFDLLKKLTTKSREDFYIVEYEYKKWSKTKGKR